MRRLKEAVLMAAGLAILAGCTAKAPDVAPIEAMIRTHTTGWVEAYNAGDVDKVAASYTPDAVVMPPDAPAATGTEAIKQYLATDMAASKAAGASFALDTDSIGVSGDLAWHSGTFHVNGPGGTSMATGKYLEVWHADNKGNWLIIRDTWNMDAPAAAPAPPPAAEPKKAPPKKKHKKK